MLRDTNSDRPIPNGETMEILCPNEIGIPPMDKRGIAISMSKPVVRLHFQPHAAIAQSVQPRGHHELAL